MVSLLDNAAPGGLLADPRPALLAQLFDMSVKKRPPILPKFTQQNGRIGLTAPQLLVDFVNSVMLPYAVTQGYRATPTDVSKMALDTMLTGGLLGRAPSGSFAVNVWHGGPHRWAAEPGFPYGRPRLDKMGTGEGAQAYGPGFYTAESKGVATDYRNILSPPPSVRVGGDAMTSSQFANTLSGKAASKYPDMPVEEIERQSGNAARMIFNRAEELKNIDGNDNVLMRAFLDSQSKRDDSLSKILRVARDEMPVAKWSEETGTLYKLDIPDEDVAKFLDWDAPLSEQPEAVKRALLGDLSSKELAAKVKAEGRAPTDTEKLQVNLRTQYERGDFNPTGERLYHWFKEKAQNHARYRDQDPAFGEMLKGSEEVATGLMAEAGIPGLKYFDGMSRGSGEGTRNFVTWDQDVLDRTKMLERDGVTLGANKSPTAATAGLLSRLPMDEPRRGPKLTQQQFDDVFLSRSKQRQKWGAERKAEREDLIRQVVETQRRRGVNSAFGAPPPLREGPREFEDPLLTAAKTRGFRAERLRKTKPYADMGQGLWSKSFQKEVNKSAAAPDLFDVESAINRANMEAVPRALKKEGWTIRHASKGRDGRVSSRYLVSPDESYEIRLTDHYLPETAERFHRMTQGQGPRWNDEIVLEGDERPMDIIEQIKSGFKGLLD